MHIRPQRILVACVILAGVAVVTYGLAAGVSLYPPAPRVGRQTHLYATWDRFEVDRCVAAWLIKRHLDPDAEFVFHPVGSPMPDDGSIAFDTPGARYERAPGKSVSQAVLAEAGVEDPAVDRLIELVRATEVGFWMLASDSEEAKLRDSLRALWNDAGEPNAGLLATFKYLDKVHAAGRRLP